MVGEEVEVVIGPYLIAVVKVLIRSERVRSLVEGVFGNYLYYFIYKKAIKPNFEGIII